MKEETGTTYRIAKTLALSLLLAFASHALALADEAIVIHDGENDASEQKNDPAIIASLKYIGEESVTWAIRPGFPDDDQNTFLYLDTMERRNRSTANVGDTFFTEEPAAGRFKFLGHVTREVFNERIEVNEHRTFAHIEDLRHNKVGIVYEFPAPLSQTVVPQFQQTDRTAIFTLEVDGHENKEFKVEEFTTFTLPPEGEGPAFKLASVNESQVNIHFTDANGQKHTITIPKGGMPEL